MALANLEEPELSHGPLEVPFHDERRGRDDRAWEVTPGMLEGSLLLNLDGEADDELTVGCAGSRPHRGALLRFRRTRALKVFPGSTRLPSGGI
jgi:hypothetical protein